MTEDGLDFRATKDIDLVLIIEAVDANFGKKFWEYVKQAGYEHCNKSSGVPQLSLIHISPYAALIITHLFVVGSRQRFIMIG